MPPWSHTVIVQWPASFGFFDLRGRLLGNLDERGLLTAFRWSDDSVSVRMGRTEILEMSSDRALLMVVGPEGGLSQARDALAAAIETIDPSTVVLTEALFQFLLPLDVGNEEARRVTSHHLLGDLLPQAVLTDWAYLVDGRSHRTRGTFQVEFGVISDEEAPERVARRVGRLWQRGLAPAPQDLFEEDYPRSSFFFDWSWSTNARFRVDEVRSDLFGLWDTLAEESEAMCKTVQAGAGMAEGSRDRQMEAE